MLNAVTTFFENIHFLRPGWLLAIPVVLLIFWRLRQHAGNSDWPAFISPHLLHYLVAQNGAAHQAVQKQQRSTLHLLWLALGLILILALAGPAWQRLPQPVQEKVNAMVIVLDLSLSMTSTDITPSRIARARFKIQDILAQRQEGLTGLVVYAGEAHTVVPLTEDTANIAALLPSLTPWLMPVKGSRPDLAIAQAISVLQGGTDTFSTKAGHILLISDALKPDEIASVNAHLVNTAHRVSILTVGTAEGAPIVLPDGQYLKDAQGHLVLPRVDFAAMNDFAKGIRAKVTPMRNTDADVKQILNTHQSLAQNQNTAIDATQDVWRDEAFWLVWLLIPLGALMFRRGYLLTLCTCAVFLSAASPQNSYALDWADLWQRKDQRAQQAFDAGDFETANQQFEDPAWRRAAAYRAEDYQAAASEALNTNTAADHYNRANALALSGDLAGALKAYDTALTADPNLDSAQHNRDVVEALLKQLESSQAQNEQSQDGQSQDEQSQNEQSQDGQSQKGQSQEASQENSNSASKENQTQQNQQAQNQQDDTQNQPQQAQSEDEKDLEALEKRKAQREAQRESQKQEQEQMAQANQADSEQDSDNQNDQPAQAARPLSPDEQMQNRITEEQQQALERVIDDPGGLLRRKFILESRRRQREQLMQPQAVENGQIW